MSLGGGPFANVKNIPYLGSLITIIIPPLSLGLLNAGSISVVAFLYLALQVVQLAMGSMVEPKTTKNSLSINTVAVLSVGSFGAMCGTWLSCSWPYRSLT